MALPPGAGSPGLRLVCLCGFFVGEPPGESQLAWWFDVQECPGGPEAVGHSHVVLSARHGVEDRLAAHPLHVAGGIGEVGENILR
jgi:hypothetical protein